jgi:hypothetical protein
MSAVLELGFCFLLFWKIVPDAEGEIRDDFTWLHIFIPIIMAKALVFGVRGMIMVETLIQPWHADDEHESVSAIRQYKEQGAEVDEKSLEFTPKIAPDWIVSFVFFLNAGAWLAWRILLYTKLENQTASGKKELGVMSLDNLFLAPWISIIISVIVITAFFRPVVFKQRRVNGVPTTKIYRMGHLEAFSCAFNAMVFQLILVILLEEKLVLRQETTGGWGMALLTLWIFAVVLIIASFVLFVGMTFYHYADDHDIHIGGVELPAGYARCIFVTIIIFLLPMAGSFLAFLVYLTDELDGSKHHSPRTILIPLMTYFAAKAALALVADLMIDYWEHQIHSSEVNTQHKAITNCTVQPAVHT